MLLNLSNHAAAKWSAEQKHAAAQRFGEIHDMAFPAIAPDAELEHIFRLAQVYVRKCQEQFDRHQQPATSIQQPASSFQHPDSAIHVMGEMTFVYQFVKLATAAGLRCIASTTERLAVDHPDGSKTSEFRFVRFREYEQME